MKNIVYPTIVACYLASFQYARGQDSNDVSISEVEDGDFPFMASIRQYGLHYCAGSIITPMFILTSAYCCFDNHNELLPVEDMDVAVANTSWKNGEIYQVANVYIHNSYSSVDFQSNVALLKVEKPIMPDEYASAIILNHNLVDEDQSIIRATVIGWGTATSKRKFASKGTDTLTKSSLLSITSSKCSYVYKRVYAEELCMVAAESEDSCSADPGSPLVVEAGDKIVQIGIASYGADCSTATPEVFTRISSYFPWIKSMLDRARRNAL